MNKATILIYTFILILLFPACKKAPDRTVLYDFEMTTISLPSKMSLRGLSVLSDSTWWISGSNGTAAYISYTDGQADSKSLHGYNHKDFRDVHGWNEREAIILSVGDSTLFLKTKNRWGSIDTVYADFTPGVFVDAFDFNSNHGIAFGDALAGVLYVLESEDAGETWTKIASSQLPEALIGEGGFAASGTNVDLVGTSVFIGTGAGNYPRLLKRPGGQLDWEVTPLPLQRGPTQGVYSIVFKSEMEGVVVGGSFQDSSRSDSVGAITLDGGSSWKVLSPGNIPGYRSCVAHSTKLGIYLVTGRNGIDYSYDGIEWIPISKQTGYYTCAFGDKSAILVGRNGMCAKIDFTKIES